MYLHESFLFNRKVLNMTTFKSKCKRHQRRLINAKVEKVICELRAENLTRNLSEGSANSSQIRVQTSTSNYIYSLPSTSSGSAFSSYKKNHIPLQISITLILRIPQVQAIPQRHLKITMLNKTRHKMLI